MFSQGFCFCRKVVWQWEKFQLTLKVQWCRGDVKGTGFCFVSKELSAGTVLTPAQKINTTQVVEALLCLIWVIQAAQGKLGALIFVVLPVSCSHLYVQWDLAQTGWDWLRACNSCSCLKDAHIRDINILFLIANGVLKTLWTFCPFISLVLRRKSLVIHWDLSKGSQDSSTGVIELNIKLPFPCSL